MNKTKPKKQNGYHIKTFDEFGNFNFFTEAETNKKALRKLLFNSSDFKNIVSTEKTLTIKVKKIY